MIRRIFMLRSGLQFKSVAIHACVLLWTVGISHLRAQDLLPEESPVPPPNTPPSPAVPAAEPESQPQSQPIGQKPEVTRFGKITVVGSKQNVRSGISSMADKMRVELNKICGEPQREMKLPLTIQLVGEEGDQEQARSVASAIKEVQGQYQLIVYVHLAKGVNHDLLRYHLMEMFLYERGLADGQTVAEGERVLVKPWLILGMLEAIKIKAGEPDRRIYQADMAYLDVMPLQKVFDASEKQWRAMIGRDPIAFRAISGAMVNALFRQPEGRPAMSAYLAAVPTFKGENENLMRQHFPGMNKSTNSLQKWVNLELLELSTARLTQVHSILETDKRLDDILKLRYRNAKQEAVSVGIDGYSAVMKLKPLERFEAVAGARAELERLSYRCFPSYRPLINEYEMVLRDITQAKDESIKTRLSTLIDRRLKMKASGQRVRDYLDWYYITQSNELSGDFDKYRDVLDALEKEKMRPPADDSTQQYLDQIQRLFGSGSSARDK